MNLVIGIMMIAGGVVGICSTLYLFLSMPVLIGWKLYRKAKFHISLFD